MDGFIIGVFGTSEVSKTAFLNSIAKKNETEGIVVYHRTESGKRFSFLDDYTFPEKIQGYARIASLSDFAYYIFPPSSKLAPPDGELALLIDSQHLEGKIISVDTPGFSQELVQSSFKGLNLARWAVEERNTQSSIIDLTKIKSSTASPNSGTLVYIDRTFNVKGVGLVVLGFVTSGKVSIHDKLRLIPSSSGKFAEVKGIQVSDEDQESAGRGIRVGLSLKGVELNDLAKTSWLDDGSFSTANKIALEFVQNPYYKQSVADRDLHLECNGKLLSARISRGLTEIQFTATLASEVPLWDGMKVVLIDLNGKLLRVAGGGQIALT